ncbi:hypothetical protein ACFSKU_12580 [Pontibacter silvestris]|uniref:Uncharacterized protein n=1 Tax=Pontibacter silvestris TaxID=2305183 RepID=A0ABW4WZR1_9BACT
MQFCIRACFECAKVGDVYLYGVT